MAWNGGWGNHTPRSAREVAEAFYAGKSKRRSSCRTDGSSYWFLSSDDREIEIARRITSEDEMLSNVVLALDGHAHRRPLEFNLRGWPTPTTARHFNALGLKAQCIGTKKPRFIINGRYMPDDYITKSLWFTLDDVRSWPTEHPEDAARRQWRELRERNRQYRQGREFVQLTPSLFDTCGA